MLLGWSAKMNIYVYIYIYYVYIYTCADIMNLYMSQTLWSILSFTFVGHPSSVGDASPWVNQCTPQILVPASDCRRGQTISFKSLDLEITHITCIPIGMARINDVYTCNWKKAGKYSLKNKKELQLWRIASSLPHIRKRKKRHSKAEKMMFKWRQKA